MRKLLHLLIISFFLTSCYKIDITKRIHRKGFHVQVISTKHKNLVEYNSTQAENLKEPVLNKMVMLSEQKASFKQPKAENRNLASKEIPRHINSGHFNHKLSLVKLKKKTTLIPTKKKGVLLDKKSSESLTDEDPSLEAHQILLWILLVIASVTFATGVFIGLDVLGVAVPSIFSELIFYYVISNLVGAGISLFFWLKYDELKKKNPERYKRIANLAFANAIIFGIPIFLGIIVWFAYVILLLAILLWWGFGNS